MQENKVLCTERTALSSLYQEEGPYSNADVMIMSCLLRLDGIVTARLYLCVRACFLPLQPNTVLGSGIGLFPSHSL